MNAAALDQSADIGRAWLDRAYQYAEDVRSGKILACEFVNLAVERFYSDLDSGHERGLYFDESSAARFFRFVGKYCRHYQGELAGQRIDFSPHQCFIEANIYGWLREDGTRRFRSSFEAVARKDGKTTRLSATGLYGMIADGEQGAKVYSAATNKNQAKELFNSAKAMVKKSPALQRFLLPRAHDIVTRDGLSEFRPLASNDDKLDGLNTHVGLIDELHAHKNSAVFDVIESSQGARRQPLLRSITTAGFDRSGHGYVMWQYAVKVLRRVIDDDSFFAIIYTLDEDDLKNWDDPKLWIKANPNLGVSVKIDEMIDRCRKAKEIPSSKVEFLTKRLNVWTYSDSVWMHMDRWHKCRLDFDSLAPWYPEKASDLDGRECYGAIDLSAIEDMTALRLLFVLENGDRITIGRTYLPEAALERRLKKGDKTLEQYRDAGHLVVTPGDVVDYDWMERDIIQACERFDVKAIAYDRWNSSQLVNKLTEHGIEMVKFGQGFGSMNGPMKELMRLVLTGQLRHNDPLLTWAIGNVVVEKNPAGDIKPDKSKVSEKIDPALALIMCVGLSMGAISDDEGDINDMLSNPL
jgi:phage terminase large subunit-like protein